MFIQTEATPNPATLKFLPGRVVMPSGTADVPTADSAVRSPLAQALFAIEGVGGVFFGADFVTVTRIGAQDWHVMKPVVLGAIMEHFTAGRPILAEGATVAASGATGEDDDIVVQIKELKYPEKLFRHRAEGANLDDEQVDLKVKYDSNNGSTNCDL